MLKQLGFNNTSIKLLVLVIILTIAIIASFFLTKPKNILDNSEITIPKNQPIDKFNYNETNYKEAYPQQFSTLENDQNGSLIIDSLPQGVRVLIDSPEQEATQDGVLNPVNITPFKISKIPVGDHNLSAFLKGFNLTDQPFIIKQGQVTRIMLQLTPQEKKVGY